MIMDPLIWPVMEYKGIRDFNSYRKKHGIIETIVQDGILFNKRLSNFFNNALDYVYGPKVLDVYTGEHEIEPLDGGNQRWH